MIPALAQHVYVNGCLVKDLTQLLDVVTQAAEVAQDQPIQIAVTWTDDEGTNRIRAGNLGEV